MRTRKGFTIVELVIVIAVIAILAAVLIPSFSGIVEKTEKNTALKLAEAAYKEARAQALEDYNKDPENNVWPIVVEVNGLTYVITKDGSGDSIFSYPDDGSFKYQIKIENKKVSLGEKLSIYNPDGDNYVNDTPATGVEIHRETLTLEVGQTEILHAAVQPATAANKTVTWSSSNTGVATVDPNSGLVTAVAEGTAIINVKASAGDPKECTVTVERVKVNFVSLNSLNMSFTMGDAARQLSATVKPDSVAEADKVITWSSTNPNVATVVDGLVTPVGPGYTTITATNNKTATCGVTVNGLVLGATTQELIAGSIFRVPYTVYPTNSHIEWNAVDGNVATVDQNGVVTAVGAGTTNITATAMGITKTIAVTVNGASNTDSITLDKTSAFVKVGETLTLTATHSGTEVEWTSSAEEVATVDGGVVTGVATGATTITATAKNGEQIVGKATCEVTVYTSVAETSCTVEIKRELESIERVSIIDGGIATLTAAVENHPADYTVVWTSSNSNVATVDGGVVTAINPGTATITAAVKVTETIDEISVEKIVAFATCDITVKAISVTVEIDSTHAAFSGATTVDSGTEYTARIIPIQGYSINSISVKIGSNDVEHNYDSAAGTLVIAADRVKGGDISITITTQSNEQIVVPITAVTLDKPAIPLECGATATLKATIEPGDATNKTLTWYSSNTNVASVDANGKVTAHNAGTATITVFTSNGKTATCEVTVSGAPVTGVALNKTELELAVGGSETLTATVEPDGATNKKVIWKSNKPAIATVDENGTVTGISAGTTTIVVITEDGNHIDVCTVTVTTVGGAVVPGDVAVTGVTLSETTMTVGVGLTKTLTATVEPNNATNQTITWSSNDTNIATVDQNGVVTGKVAGSTTITANTEDGSYTATCTVTVKTAYNVAFASESGANIDIIEPSKAVEGENYNLQLKAKDGYIITSVVIKVGTRTPMSLEPNKGIFEDVVEDIRDEIIIEATAKHYSEWETPFDSTINTNLSAVVGFVPVGDSPFRSFYINGVTQAVSNVEVYLCDEDARVLKAEVTSLQSDVYDGTKMIVTLGAYDFPAAYFCAMVTFENSIAGASINLSIAY